MIRAVTVPWGRARRIAAGAATARPGVVVALADMAHATGTVLAEPVVARTPLPPFDIAAADGYAVSGPGPWTVEQPVGGRLPDGAATRVVVDAALPSGTDAVVPSSHAVVREGTGATWLYVGDAAAGRQSDRPGHVPPGTAVHPTGRDCGAGERLAEAGQPVTPAVVAAAAAGGLDALLVVRPPEVALVVVGDQRLGRGQARDGRSRDATTPAIAAAVARAGGRCQPVRVLPGTPGNLDAALREVLQDVLADLVVVTGDPGEATRADVARALADLGATVVLADVAVRPGGDTLLAELTDGRLVAYVPGDLERAFGALVTTVLPVLRAMAGQQEPAPVLALVDVALPGDPVATTLVPVHHRRGELADTAEVVPGGPVRAYAAATSVAVVPPGGTGAGQLVELVVAP